VPAVGKVHELMEGVKDMPIGGKKVREMETVEVA
jgi:hypothetical protein